MKNTIRILLMLMLSVSLTSCEKIKNLFDIEVDTTIEGELYIQTDATETKSTEAYEFHKTITVQVLNDDLYEYQDEIDDFVVSGVTATVDSLSVDEVVLLTGTAFSMSNDNYSVSWILDSDWTISEGTSFNLEDAGLYDVVEDILYDMLPFTMSADGEADQGDVFMIIRLGVETTVNVNPT
jgi:hypothetical protein